MNTAPPIEVESPHTLLSSITRRGSIHHWEAGFEWLKWNNYRKNKVVLDCIAKYKIMSMNPYWYKELNTWANGREEKNLLCRMPNKLYRWLRLKGIIPHFLSVDRTESSLYRVKFRKVENEDRKLTLQRRNLTDFTSASDQSPLEQS